jgi:hypothetical protein
MANPTTNFGWVMPTATDLVTDLPADFAVFGQGVDTSMAYLLGGTTGQILSKTSATNMAFTWISNDQGDLTAITAGTGISVTSGTGPIPSVAIDTAVTVDKTTAQTLTNKTLTSPALTTPTISTLTTNGDLVYGTGSGALSRLGIGSSAQVLTVTGGVPVWATPAGGGGKVLQVVQTTSTTATTVTGTTFADTGLSGSITPTLATSKVLVMITQSYNSYKSGGNYGGGKILRGSTTIYDGDSAGKAQFIGNTADRLIHTSTLVYLDSPATTSSTTYKTQVANENVAGTITCQNGGTIPGIIILLEIGA